MVNYSVNLTFHGREKKTHLSGMTRPQQVERCTPWGVRPLAEHLVDSPGELGVKFGAQKWFRGKSAWLKPLELALKTAGFPVETRVKTRVSVTMMAKTTEVPADFPSMQPSEVTMMYNKKN